MKSAYLLMMICVAGFCSATTESLKAIKPFVRVDFSGAMPGDGWTMGAQTQVANSMLYVRDDASATLKDALLGNTTTISLQATFTLPSVNPDLVSSLKNDRLAIVADKDGQLWISDGLAWVNSGEVVTASDDVRTVLIRPFLNADDADKLYFDVRIGATEKKVLAAEIIGEPPFLGVITFDGEGQIDNILLTSVPTATLPSDTPADTVDAYGQWAADKNGGEPSTTKAQMQAFLLNVDPADGAASLKITDMQPDSLTIAASQEGKGNVPLREINGVLTVHASEELGSAKTVHKVNLSSQSDGEIKVPLPVGRFMQAKVELNPTTLDVLDPIAL